MYTAPIYNILYVFSEVGNDEEVEKENRVREAEVGVMIETNRRGEDHVPDPHIEKTQSGEKKTREKYI